MILKENMFFLNFTYEFFLWVKRQLYNDGEIYILYFTAA